MIFLGEGFVTSGSNSLRYQNFDRLLETGYVKFIVEITYHSQMTGKAKLRMRQQLILTLASIAAFVSGQNVEESSFGRYFRLMYLDNFVDCPVDRPLDLYICNKLGQPSANFEVKLIGWKHKDCSDVSDSVVANGCKHVKLCGEIRHTYADGSLAKKVLTITSDQDVSVTGFNVEKFSADSFLVLPWASAGMTHCIMTYTLQTIQTQFGIVADKRTMIRITIPDRRGETITIDYMGLRYTNGEMLEFTLSPNHTFLAQSAGDLTGVLIQSDKPVAVFAGNVRTWNSFISNSRDHLVEQLPSNIRWGQDFVYVPAPRRNRADRVRFMARFPNTLIELRIEGEEPGTIGIKRGAGFIDLVIDAVCHIKSNRQILVAVIVKSQEGAAAGIEDPADPSMYYLPAVSQYATEFYVPSFRDSAENPYSKTFVILAFADEDLVTIDGASLTSILNATAARLTVPGSLPYSTAVLALNGQLGHTILSTKPMMAIAYGASDRESYASTLGYAFNLSCIEQPMAKNDGIDNDCDGQIDEETCGNELDDDLDGLIDEDCKGEADATGKVFAVVFQSNIVEKRPEEIGIDEVELYISALENDTLINVTAPAYVGQEVAPNIINRAAPFGEVLQLTINPAMRMGNLRSELADSSRAFKGIKIESSKDIVVYGINKKEFSTDGFLAIPTAVIGYEYMAFCYSPINSNDDRCQFAMVATEDDTEIIVELPAGIRARSPDGSFITHTNPAVYNMSAWEAIEIKSDDDLTGARVYATDRSKRFAFFSGNTRTRIPSDRTSRDHLVEQLPSIDTWGLKFSTASTPRAQPIGDVWKVIAAEPNTFVTYTYIDSFGALRSIERQLRQAGNFLEIDLLSNSNLYINGSKPILVIQMVKSATDKDTDPAAIVVPPQSQWSNNYRFVTPLSGQTEDESGLQKPFNNSLIIVINKELRAGLRFEAADGETLDIGSDPAWSPVPSTDNEVMVYLIPHGQNLLSHVDPSVTFMAIMFGRADRETYGYAVGLRLVRRICEAASQEMFEGDGIDNDCDGTIDEETCGDGIDNDGDGEHDEDCVLHPSGFMYYLAFLENKVENPRNYPLEIYVANPSDDDTRCRLCTPNVTMHYTPFYDVTIDIAAGEVKQFALSSYLRLSGTRLMWNAISVECDNAVTVMGVNKETYSNDAFLAYNTQQLGYTYYTVSFSPATYCTQFAVVPFEPGSTLVKMDLAAPVVFRGITYNKLGLLLIQHEIFQGQSDVKGGDLTGTKVFSDRKIAVFSGNVRTRVSLSASRDHLATQLPPVGSWGSQFYLVPILFRTVGDVIRVVSSEDDTTVRFQGRSYSLASAGNYLQFDLSSNSTGGELTATKPVMVVQIMKSQTGPRVIESADPCMLLISPTSQYVNRSGLITPLYSEGSYQSGRDYNNTLTLIYPRGSFEGFLINGRTLNYRDYSVKQRRAIDGTNHEAADIVLNIGGRNAYTIKHQQGAMFSGYMIGIADRESYCVGVGLNLPNIA